MSRYSMHMGSHELPADVRGARDEMFLRPGTEEGERHIQKHVGLETPHGATITIWEAGFENDIDRTDPVISVSTPERLQEQQRQQQFQKRIEPRRAQDGSPLASQRSYHSRTGTYAVSDWELGQYGRRGR